MKRLSLSLVVVLASASLPSACAGGVSGPVDGDSVPQFLSSGFASARVQRNVFGFGVDIDAVIARFYSFYGACDLVAADLAIQNEESGAQEAEEREELYRERSPQEYWSLELSITASDEDDLDGRDLTPGRQEDDFTLAVSLCRVKDFPDAEGERLVFDEECYRGNGGELEFRYEEQRYMDVVGNLELIEEDGDEAGEVDFSGGASWCEPADDELDDLL